MFKLRAVQAEFGDCLLLDYGTAEEPHHILVDGGPPNTYKDHLQCVLVALSAARQDLELVVLSHVDNDHVVGLVDLFSELTVQKANNKPLTIDFGGLWHNSFSDTIDKDGSIAAGLKSVLSTTGAKSLERTDAAFLGVPEGNKLRTLALQLDKALNEGFPNNLILADRAPTKTIAGLKIQIVGPIRADLDALRDEWVKFLKKLEDAVASNDVQTLANSDKSVPNLSSIMFLAEYEGKSILLTGDGRSDHLLNGLKMAGLLDHGGTLSVDVLKLPHHGSDRDITKTFFQKVTASTYVVSANGRYGNPDYSTLEWLVQAAAEQRRTFTLIATNDTPSLKKFLKTYSPTKYNYRLVIMKAGDNFIEVEIGS